VSIEKYLEPVNYSKSKYITKPEFETLFCNIDKFDLKTKPENLNKYDIALIGIPEDRNSKNTGCSLAPDIIRNELYELYRPSGNENIIDLGNLKPGNKIKDTYIAISDIIEFLRNKNIIPVVIGGTNDLISPIISAYKEKSKDITLCTIDSRLDFGEPENFNSETYLGKIINDCKNIDFRFIGIGYQTYYCSSRIIELLDKNLNDLVRLGKAQDDIVNTEYLIRDCDIFSIDVNSVRSSDAPGNYNASIHGFYGEELCQIAKYAGMSDKLSTFGIFEINPKFDTNNRTSKLAAQAIWHFIQGYYKRRKEIPGVRSAMMKKLVVLVPDLEDQEIIFYNSIGTGRWWFELPSDEQIKKIISCSYSDYTNATSAGEIPNKWWNEFRKK